MIENEEGTEVYKEEEIAKTIERYFTKLFTPNVCNLDYMKDIISEAIDSRVTNEQNEKLIAVHDPEEIKEALFSINPEKAQALMGFLRAFSNQTGELWAET